MTDHQSALRNIQVERISLVFLFYLFPSLFLVGFFSPLSHFSISSFQFMGLSYSGNNSIKCNLIKYWFVNVLDQKHKFRLRILIIKPTRCTNFSNLILEKNQHVSDSSSVHHQEFFTVHTAMVYVIRVCYVYSEKLLMMDRGTVRNI